MLESKFALSGLNLDQHINIAIQEYLSGWEDAMQKVLETFIEDAATKVKQVKKEVAFLKTRLVHVGDTQGASPPSLSAGGQGQGRGLDVGKAKKRFEELETRDCARKNDIEKLQGSVSSLKAEVDEGSKMLKRIKKKCKKYDVMKHQGDSLQSSIKTLEVNQCRKNIVVKGIPLFPKAASISRQETQEETLHQIEKLLLQPLGLTGFKFTAQRMGRGHYYTRRNQDGSTSFLPPLIRVSFDYKSIKSKIWKAMKGKKNILGSQISIQDEFPPILKKEKKKAEQMAFGLRRNGIQENTRAFVVMRNDKVCVLVKKVHSATKYLTV